jgi:hypothetical protein
LRLSADYPNVVEVSRDGTGERRGAVARRALTSCSQATSLTRECYQFFDLVATSQVRLQDVEIQAASQSRRAAARQRITNLRLLDS